MTAKLVSSKMNIIVKLQLEGLHHWPTCDIDEVNYLRSLHRHVFYIECKKKVTHSDRDIEIIQLKHNIIDFMNDRFYDKNHRCLNLSSLSCEAIAELLCDSFELNYCSVLEDNENGAELYREVINE